MKYYNSIDFIPIKNFFLANEKNDLRYLLKLTDYENLPVIDKVLESELSNAFFNILSEFPENSFDNEILRIKYEIELLRGEISVSGDQSIFTHIFILEKQLSNKLSVKNLIKSNYFDEIINIENTLKIEIDETKCTLKKYFAYRKKINEIINTRKNGIE